MLAGLCPGIGVGNCASGYATCLPQWGVACPNGGKDAHGRAKLPTPMGGSLPQQGTGRARTRQVAYPNGRSPAPIGQCMPLRHSTLTPSCCGVPNRAVTSAFRAGSAFGSAFSLTGPPQGAVVVQNASGFRCFRRTQHEGGPKCVSVRRFWPDSCDFGQTQTHFGPRTRKDPGSARDSDAFRTTKQLNHRATGAGLAPVVADPGRCPARPPGRRATGSNNVPADSAEVPRCAPS